MYIPTEAQQRAAREQFDRVVERTATRMLAALQSARLSHDNGWPDRVPDFLGLRRAIGQRFAELADGHDLDYLVFGILAHLDKHDPPPPTDLLPKAYRAALNQQHKRLKALKTFLRLVTIDGKDVIDEVADEKKQIVSRIIHYTKGKSRPLISEPVHYTKGETRPLISGPIPYSKPKRKGRR